MTVGPADRRTVLVAVGIVAAGVGVLALGVIVPRLVDGPAATPDAREDGRHNVTITRRVQAGRTALLMAVRAEQPTKIETHRTNAGWWNDTRMTVLKNVAIGESDHRALTEVALGTSRRTTCSEGDPGDAPVVWGIRSCPRRDVQRYVNSSSKGVLEGAEVWYVAAFGADRADISVTLHASRPVEILWTQSARTDLTILHENETEQGTPQGGPEFLAHANWSTARPAYGEFVIAGEFQAEPTWEARGEGRRFRFSPNPPGYRNRKGTLTALPAFPVPSGDYTLHAEGGMRSLEAGRDEVAGLALAEIDAPRFLTDDAWFPSIRDPGD